MTLADTSIRLEKKIYKKLSFCRKMRFQGKKFNADVEALCPSGMSAVTLI